MEQTGNMLRLQGYTATGIGFYTNGAYKSLMDRKVRDIAEERDPRVYLEMMYKGYKPQRSSFWERRISFPKR